MVKAQRVTFEHAALQEPASDVWETVAPADIALQPTPLAAQPSVYVQAKWGAKPYGTTTGLGVRAAHNGERLYFRLAWEDPTADTEIGNTDKFGDAAAVLFPVGLDAPLAGMGSADQPVNAWYWRADVEDPWSVLAQGPGTTRRTADPRLAASAEHRAAAWNVVISRDLGPGDDGSPPLRAGYHRKVGFAVWQGANQERGGLKAVTLDWQPLEIEA